MRIVDAQVLKYGFESLEGSGGRGSFVFGSKVMIATFTEVEHKLKGRQSAWMCPTTLATRSDSSWSMVKNRGNYVWHNHLDLFLFP